MPVASFFERFEVPGKRSLYINEDIQPLPPSRRTWNKQTFFLFWMSTSINISTLSGASSILALGLTVWQAIVTDIIGATIITLAMVANGCQGGKWHIPFAVGNRTGWGVNGASFVVLNRLILSFCWYGVQTWFGGQVIKNMIGAIWPGFYSMHNHFPASAAMHTNDFIGFLIFWTISLPLLAVKPERYRIPALVFSAMTIVAVFSLLIWALAKQGGAGPLINAPQKLIGVKKLEGAALGWAMARSVTTTIGGWAGAVLYQSDYARYAKRSGDQIIGQIFVIPICLIGSSVIGLLITSCAAGFYPDEPLLWRPYKLIQVIQETEGTAGARAACFFLALCFFVSQFGVNIAGCAITGGIDLASMFPKWVDTKRGPFIVAIVGFAINPWQLLNTANVFISVLSGYSIFLGPLTGIMACDYFIVRRSTLKLVDLYTPGPSSIYWYWNGINPKAPIVWALSVFPSLPGFAYTLSKGKLNVPIGWVHTSYLAWVLGFTISFVLWYLVNRFDPPPGLGEVDETDVYGTFSEIDSREEVEEGSVKEKTQGDLEDFHTLRK